MTHRDKKAEATLCARRARKIALRQQHTMATRAYEAVARHATVTAVAWVTELVAEREDND
jgi:hypothetical protein